MSEGLIAAPKERHGKALTWRGALIARARQTAAATLPPGVKAFLKKLYAAIPNADPRAVETIRLHRLRMLSCGYSERGRRQLVDWAGESTDIALRRRALWELANWHRSRNTQEDRELSLDYFGKLLDIENRASRIVQARIRRSQLRSALGEPAAAHAELDALAAVRDHEDVVLARADISHEVETRLGALNATFRKLELSEITLLPDDGGTAFDRLTSVSAAPGADDGEPPLPLISVIVPAYNAETTIGTAIRSLQMQTHRNIEILVVDDCSSDGTVAVLRRLREEDPRIHIFEQTRNSGAYSARNRALVEARGEFVTCHDSDDWSHPSKLEIQARRLLAAGEGAIANCSRLIFVGEDLAPRARGSGGFFRENFSSLLFRREPVLEKVGGWDTARFAADSEFQQRISIAFGWNAVRSVPLPLSLVRYAETSLTASNAFGYHGYHMGARLFYVGQYQRFHQSGAPKRLSPSDPKRAFYIPEPMRPARTTPKGARRDFDVVCVFDFRLGGADERRGLETIESLRRSGSRVAIFHLPLYEPDPLTPMRPSVLRMLEDGAVEMLVTGERVACRKLLVLSPRMLVDRNDHFLDVEAENTEIVDDGPVLMRVVSGAQTREICDANMRSYCGAPISWTSVPSARAGGAR
ncbi:MAG: glycosyltransferase family 2 protein [Devosia nanyangense]|uniref:Glycosyltransferase family 2 protein n=1 Tax=Devosia nanyangense TaxID=1228055 RepID=A0A933KYR0_9HYPH|nr:glycosyltransferase family 2 protein [Devosia nanyangense]